MLAETISIDVDALCIIRTRDARRDRDEMSTRLTECRCARPRLSRIDRSHDRLARRDRLSCRVQTTATASITLAIGT
jgi:hypothetical protein